VNRTFLFLWVSVLLAACGGETAENYYTPERCLAEASCPWALVSAHRGMCGSEPENTLAAFQECARLGVTMVEVDARQTADGIWVVMHDDDVLRTTNGGELFPNRVKVEELTAAEFASLTIKDDRCLENPQANPARCRPPLLEEVFRGVGSELLFDLDFKAGDASSLAELVLKTGVEKRLLFFDDEFESLRAYRKVAQDGLVMARAHGAEEAGQIAAELMTELDLRWLHVDPDYLAEARQRVDASVRLYLNAWDYQVDIWLFMAELASGEEDRLEREKKAWALLDELLQKGARALGTERGAQISAHLYPAGFGKQP